MTASERSEYINLTAEGFAGNGTPQSMLRRQQLAENTSSTMTEWLDTYARSLVDSPAYTKNSVGIPSKETKR